MPKPDTKYDILVYSSSARMRIKEGAVLSYESVATRAKRFSGTILLNNSCSNLTQTAQARLQGKPKKGHRRKAAEVARRARAVLGSTAVGERSNNDHHGGGAETSDYPSSATSCDGTSGDICCVASAASAGQRRRRKLPARPTASFTREHDSKV